MPLIGYKASRDSLKRARVKDSTIMYKQSLFRILKMPSFVKMLSLGWNER